MIGSYVKDGTIYVDYLGNSQAKLSKFIKDNLSDDFAKFGCDPNKDVRYVKQDKDFELCGGSGSGIVYTGDEAVARRRLMYNLRSGEADKKYFGTVAFVAQCTSGTDDVSSALVTSKHPFMTDDQITANHTEPINGYFFTQEEPTHTVEKHLVSKRCEGLYGIDEQGNDEDEEEKMVAVDIALVNVMENNSSSNGRHVEPLHVFDGDLDEEIGG